MIITGGAGCGKTWELRRRVLASRNPLLLSFTNKTVQNAKEKIKTVAAREGGLINHNSMRYARTFDSLFFENNERRALAQKTCVRRRV